MPVFRSAAARTFVALFVTLLVVLVLVSHHQVLSKKNTEGTPAKPLRELEVTEEEEVKKEGREFRSHGSRKLQPGSSFAPINDLTIVHDAHSCPTGYTPLPQDLNSGTNGKEIYLCYKRGYDKYPIQEISFHASSSSLPSCPVGFETVLKGGNADRADLNEGATGKFLLWTTRNPIAMCFRRDANSCDSFGNCEALYQLRVLKSRTGAPRWFVRIGQDLNGGVPGDPVFLAYSDSPTMAAGAVAIADENNPDFTSDWSYAVEDAGGDISVVMTLDCQRNGGNDFPLCFGATPLEEQEFQRLCDLVREGIEEGWSGHLTIQGVTRYVSVVTQESIAPNKHVDICQCGAEFGDGTTCFQNGRSHNSNFDNVIDMTMWYNKGGHPSQSQADGMFKRVAAHEIGHSFLYDYAGLTHSWGHKGSSTIAGGTTSETPVCPTSGDLDMMKYYVGGCWFDLDESKYTVSVTNWDRAKMVMTVGEYVYYDFGP